MSRDCGTYTIDPAFLISCQVRRVVHLRRGTIKTEEGQEVEEKEEEGPSSLTTIVEKQDESGPDGRTTLKKGGKKVKVQRGRKRPVRLRDILLYGLSRLWHSCFVEPSDSG